MRLTLPWRSHAEAPGGVSRSVMPCTADAGSAPPRPSFRADSSASKQYLGRLSETGCQEYSALPKPSLQSASPPEEECGAGFVSALKKG